MYSIWQASSSSKQANEILESIREIELEQKTAKNLMRVIISAVDNGKTITTSNANTKESWKTDNNID